MLPKLPKVNKKKEALFGEMIRRWIKSHPDKKMLFTMAMELKQTETDSIRMSVLKEEQLNYLLAIRNDPNGVLIRVIGIHGEPDYIFLKHEPSYIYVKFPKFFCAIAPDVWIEEKKKAKSLTSSRARAIASIVF